MHGRAATAVVIALVAALAVPGPGSAAEKRRAVLLGLESDSAGLRQIANSVSNPGSDDYSEFLSLADLRERFGASQRVAGRVMRFLRSARGVRSPELDSTGGVAMAVVGRSAARRLFCARGPNPPARPGCLPRQLRGDVNQVAAGELFARGGSSRSGVRGPRQGGTPSGCPDAVQSGSFTPNQLATAYGTDELNGRGREGQGMSAVVLSSAQVDPSTFATWAECFGLPTPAFEQTAMPGASLDTSTEPDETYLDVEAVAVAAPRLERTTAVFVPLDVSFSHSFPLFLFGALDPERQGGGLPDVLSISDGVCESQFNASQRQLSQHFLRAAAALGITVAAASGDLGFLGCQENAKGPNFPASSRYVTGVGGTEITLDPGNELASQTVWNTFTGSSNQGDGTGGGPSTRWRRPEWQVAPGVGAALQSGDPTRLTPDVASMASFTPGLAVYGGEGWTGSGGTSAATPLVAGMLALIAQGERAAGRPPLGAVNPLLYEIARGPGYSSVFYDVVTGTGSPRPNTPLGQSPAGGAAQPGYDLATGLGQPRAPALADAVAAARQP